MEEAYGMDEALLSGVAESDQPGLDIYRFPYTAVVIGRGGKAELELKSGQIAQDGIPLLRRRGGGCAVVLDPGNLVVSLGLPLSGVGGIRPAFDLISDWLIETLARCGIADIRQQGISDLVLADRKIGGSCIWRTKGLLYYSTTLLVDPKTDLMDRYLKHPPREPEYRQGRDHGSFTTSLCAAGLVDDPDDLCQCLDAETKHSFKALIRALKI